MEVWSFFFQVFEKFFFFFSKVGGLKEDVKIRVDEGLKLWSKEGIADFGNEVFTRKWDAKCVWEKVWVIERIGKVLKSLRRVERVVDTGKSRQALYEVAR